MMEVRTEQVRGATVRWRTVGSGPPLVLVHGLAGSWRWWTRIGPLLAREYECHLLDVPRFRTNFRPYETAEWLADWADATALEHLRLVGHSLGGAAAARLAADRPELVAALALLAPTGIPSRRRAAAYALPLAGSLRKSSPAFLARISLDALRTRPAALLRGGLAAIHDDVRAHTPRIHAPTLLVWGDSDPLVPASLAEDWCQTIAWARLVVLDGVGHVPMIERPHELAELLLEFLHDPRDFVGRRPVRSVSGALDDEKTPTR
jgi:pimeloyl-ACP methyl ester carboxylesterase